MSTAPKPCVVCAPTPAIAANRMSAPNTSAAAADAVFNRRSSASPTKPTWRICSVTGTCSLAPDTASRNTEPTSSRAALSSIVRVSGAWAFHRASSERTISTGSGSGRSRPLREKKVGVRIRSRTRRAGPADASRANGQRSVSKPMTDCSHGPKRTVRGGQAGGGSPWPSQPSRHSVIVGEPSSFPAFPGWAVFSGLAEPGDGTSGPTANGLVSA